MRLGPLKQVQVPSVFDPKCEDSHINGIVMILPGVHFSDSVSVEHRESV